MSDEPPVAAPPGGSPAGDGDVPRRRTAEADDASRPPTASPEEPYVGLRPFEREDRRFFFGRHRDAQFLVDKILCAPVTLLYARSGFGKSSLLKALAIPQLEDEGTIVVYFDRWTGTEPYEELRDTMIQAASEAGVPSPASGGATVWELARLLAALTGRTLVLVFDQFEELLVHHGGRLEELKKELARIAREDTFDVRMVLSLREEFLAALEPLRHEILNLFQSTYRLSGLDERGVRAAIRRPAEEAGGICDPELIDALVADLAAHQAERAAATDDAADLPMLQLICSQLWQAAEADGGPHLTLELYREKLGGHGKILDDYVHSKMPGVWGRQLFTADLLRLLAPPSGLKMSFSASDLALQTGRDRQEAEIAEELERLAVARILRSREFRGGKRYELWHDAFIRVLGPWRDEVLARRARRRQTRRRVGAAAIVAALFLAFLWVRAFLQERELHRNTDEALASLEELSEEELAAQAGARFDAATSYLLWRQEGPERLDQLAKLLQQHEDKIPFRYGVELSGLEFVTPVPEGDWPIVLEYSTARHLNEFVFLREWQSWASEVAARSGLPVPPRIQLVPQSSFPRRRFRLSVAHREPVVINLPAFEDWDAIPAGRVTGPGAEFRDRFADDWTPIPGLGDPDLDQWVAVPRWSLPVWQVSGLRALPGPGVAARMVGKHLLEQAPEVFFPPSVVELLLDRAAEIVPWTVFEAERARGAELGRDLAELVRLGRSLSDLPQLLDLLAAYPGEPSPRAAQWVDEELSGFMGTRQTRLAGSSGPQGPWDAVESEGEASTEPPHEAHRAAVEGLSIGDHPLRLHLGEALASEWLPRQVLTPRFQQSLEAARDDYYRTTGVPLPGFRIHDDLSLAPWGLRLEMMEQTARTGRELVTREESAATELEALLSEALRDRGGYWLTPDWIDYVLDETRVTDTVRGWIEEHYSRTDLKLLLRGVLGPESVDSTEDAAAAGRSLRNLNWLLASLLFWTEIEDPNDLPALVDRLRETQRALRQPSPDLPVPEPMFQSSLQILYDPEAATAAFAEAIRDDREGTIEFFLDMQPRVARLWQEVELELLCSEDDVPPSRHLRVSLSEHLEQEAVGEDAELDRSLRLCLIKLLDPLLQPVERDEAVRTALARYPDPGGWKPEELAWIVEVVAGDHDPLIDEPDLLERARGFARFAMSEPDWPDKDSFYWRLHDICNLPGGRRWCFDLLDELAASAVDDLAVAHANALSEMDLPDAWASALVWADRAADSLARRDLQEPMLTLLNNLVSASRATALWKLSLVGRGDVDEAERILRELELEPSFSEWALLELTKLMLAQDRLSDAGTIAHRLIDSEIEDASAHLQLFWVELLEGHQHRAAKIAARLIADAEAWTDPGALESARFVGALSHILLQEGDWEEIGRDFLQSEHVYAPYLAMMFYSGLAGADEARELLEERWSAIDETTWEARLGAGDAAAWREMLIGLYLGRVERDRLFAPLANDNAFAASPLANLPMPRQGLLCEAHFYEAMLAHAHGDAEQMRASLERSIDTGWRHYYEYLMARFLLEAQDAGDKLPRGAEQVASAPIG